MRFLLTSMGSRGDVQPLLGLALGLRAAGHDVVLATPPSFADWIRGLGFAFHPIGFDIYAWSQQESHLTRSPLHATRTLLRVLQDEVPKQFRDLADVVPEVDAVVATGLHMSAASLAERWKVPYHFASFVPGLLYSLSHPPAVTGWAVLPRPMNWLAWKLFIGVFDWTLRLRVNKERVALGLDAVPTIPDLFIGNDVLLAVDPDLSFIPGDIETPHVTTGAWTLPIADEFPESLERFLQAGPPPFFFGFGSVPDSEPAETTRFFIDAVHAVGGRALISRGWANYAGDSLPEGFLAVGSVSHERLFPRVAAVIHHGGAGTTQTAARAGVPQLVVPHAVDQFYWAHRVRVLGLGPKGLPRTRFSQKRLNAALRQLATGDGYRTRANALGERLRRIDGVANAVRYLEERHLRRAA